MSYLLGTLMLVAFWCMVYKGARKQRHDTGHPYRMSDEWRGRGRYGEK